ncbi:MAG TPA: fasciclin domain-containing protein [Geminicoccaceae bacterium]|nr:fasciclin domain-containing protein [Geminicoccaceae bacterium]
MTHYATLARAAALALPMALGAWAAQAADLIRTAEQDGRFNGFLALIEAAGMAETLEGEGPFTVFAPIDEAFDHLPPDMLDRLLAEKKPLEAVVQSHIVADAAILTGHLLDRAVEVPTIGGGTLAIDGTSAVILLAPIEVTITEVEAQPVVERRSGAMPVSATVVEALQDAGTNLNRSTPPAQQELVGAAAVVAPDIEADNGVIHGIDLVLLPPEALWWF